MLASTACAELRARSRVELTPYGERRTPGNRRPFHCRTARIGSLVTSFGAHERRSPGSEEVSCRERRTSASALPTDAQSVPLVRGLLRQALQYLGVGRDRHPGDRAGAHRGVRERRAARRRARGVRGRRRHRRPSAGSPWSTTATASTRRRPRPAATSPLEGGRGLLLMRALVDRLAFVQDRGRPAPGHPGEAAGHPPAAAPPADLNSTADSGLRAIRALVVPASPSRTPDSSSSACSVSYRRRTSGRIRRIADDDAVPFAHARTSAGLGGSSGTRPPGEKVASTAAVRAGRGQLGQAGAEPPVGPLLRQGTGLAEHDRNRRESGLASANASATFATGACSSEQPAVPVLDDDRRPGQRRELGEGVGELAGQETAGEVVDTLALDGGHDGAVDSTA